MNHITDKNAKTNVKLFVIHLSTNEKSHAKTLIAINY